MVAHWCDLFGQGCDGRVEGVRQRAADQGLLGRCRPDGSGRDAAGSEPCLDNHAAFFLHEEPLTALMSISRRRETL